MVLTGHKSVSSLAVYEKVNDVEKLNMGDALGYKLLNPDKILQQVKSVENLALPPPPKSPAQTVQKKENVFPENCVIPLETPNFDLSDDLSDMDLLKVLSEVENEELVKVSQQQTHVNSTSSTSTSQQVMKRQAPPVPMMFANCQITGNITINLNK